MHEIVKEKEKASRAKEAQACQDTSEIVLVSGANYLSGGGVAKREL